MTTDDELIDRGAAPGARGVITVRDGLQRYVVAPGDRLAAIAERFAVPEWALLDARFRPASLPSGPLRDPVVGETLSVLSLLRSVEIALDGEGPEAQGIEDGPLPPPHPAFLERFGSAFYRDEADEFAPFGTDEGWDARAVILSADPDLMPTATVARLLAACFDVDLQPFDADVDLAGTAESDPLLIGVAFTVLWATGRIDPAGHECLVAALRRQIARYGQDPRLVGMLADVEALLPDRDQA